MGPKSQSPQKERTTLEILKCKFKVNFNQEETGKMTHRTIQIALLLKILFLNQFHNISQMKNNH